MDESEEVSKGLVEGLIEALSDKHSQVDIRLQDLTMNLADSRVGVKVSGTITIAVHMRDLTAPEKEAHVASNLAAIRQ